MSLFKNDFKTNERIRQDAKFARLVEVIRKDPSIGTGELRERFGVGDGSITRARQLVKAAA